jgi:primosomal replication protein N
MVERIVPRIVTEIEKEPADAFREIQDVAWHVLKGIDLLGIYAKKHRQTKREAGICRTIARHLPAQVVGERLSHMTKRQFQPAGYLIDFLRRSDPDVFKQVLRAIDWSAIDATIGDDWETLFHDGEVFLRIASLDKETERTIIAIIEERLKDAKILRPKVALLSPKLIERHLDENRAVAIDTHDHIDWVSAAVIVARLVESRPDLVPTVVEPLVLPVSAKLSKSHPSFWRDAHLFFHLIRQFAPNFLDRMLDGVDPSTAESNWIAGIKSPPDVRRATTILVDSALSRGDGVGQMARRIRRKYPAMSKPIKEDTEEFTFSNATSGG